MTQSPIDPHHKDQAANMLSQSYDRILTIAQTLANDEAKGKALAEINRIAVENDWPNLSYAADIRAVAAIAAPYRASDPVAEALKAEAMTIVLAESVPRTIQQIEAIRNGIAGQGKIDLVMRALKRGMELARTIEGHR